MPVLWSAMPSRFTAALLHWYRNHRRDLPWRRTSDPYAIWVSEVMLQQTRVETVIPYYERFLARFPDVCSLASAPEQDLLSCWAGLGYYSRVRNMQRAAAQISRAGRFPSDHDSLRRLPGIGDYTAAAVASIAFAQPYAVLDGNVMRAMARLTNDAGDLRAPATRERLRQAAASRLDRTDPGSFNQALMELGATLCVPATPDCPRCPVQGHCAARQAGRERELPIKSRPANRKTAQVTLLLIERRSEILLWQRPAASPRLAGFWELPEPSMLPRAKVLETVGVFRHGITDTSYTITVQRASIAARPRGFIWASAANLSGLPLSTTSRKALSAAHRNINRSAT